MATFLNVAIVAVTIGHNTERVLRNGMLTSSVSNTESPYLINNTPPHHGPLSSVAGLDSARTVSPKLFASGCVLLRFVALGAHSSRALRYSVQWHSIGLDDDKLKPVLTLSGFISLGKLQPQPTLTSSPPFPSWSSKEALVLQLKSPFSLAFCSSTSRFNPISQQNGAIECDLHSSTIHLGPAQPPILVTKRSLYCHWH